MLPKNNMRRCFAVVWMAVAIVIAGCGGSSTDSGYNGPYGGAQNHLHDLLAPQGMANTVLVASHVGLYRSADGGAHWNLEAGTTGQPMDGLMIFKLAQSSVDPQRIYVLAISRADGPQAAHPVPGIYASANGGVTWQIAAPLSALPGAQPFTIGAGSTSAGEIFALDPANNVLLRSMDGGAHWQAITTPADPHGIIGDPGHAHRAFLWSITGGFSVSTDDGTTWHASPGIQDGIFSVALAGNGRIYASGNDGVFVSTDDGAHFALVAPGTIMTTISTSPAQPMTVFGLTGTSVIRSTDGGTTWNPAGSMAQHVGLLTSDPGNGQQIYAGASYPIAVMKSDDAGSSWQTMLP
jgi:hypothetical protein